MTTNLDSNGFSIAGKNNTQKIIHSFILVLMIYLTTQLKINTKFYTHQF